MDLYRAIQLRALLCVTKEDPDYTLRRMLRWYSKTFHTSLSAVEDMPVEDVVQTYYEEHFAELDEEALEKVREDLLETDDEKKARLRAADEEEADGFEYAKIVEEEEAVKAKLEETKKKKPEDGMLAEVEIPGALGKQELPPNIIMKFEVSEDEFEKEIEGYGLMDQPKKR